MERERQGKNIVIAVLLVTVLCMSAAFAAFTNIQLQVDGTVNLPDAKWDVKFTGAVVDASTDITTAPSHTDNTVTFTVDLEENSDYVIKATITNNGSYDAKLKSLTEPTTIPTELATLITQSVTGVNVGDTIAAGASVDVTITVSMGEISTDALLEAVQANESLTLTWIAEFEQA